MISETKYCRICGFQLHPNSIFCSKCGIKIVTVEQPNHDMKSSKETDTPVKKTVVTEEDSTQTKSPSVKVEKSNMEQTNNGARSTANSKTSKNVMAELNSQKFDDYEEFLIAYKE